MSMNPVNACQGKSSFTRWGDAKRRAFLIERRTNEPVNVYRCSICGNLHLGVTNKVFRARCCDFRRRKAEYELHEREAEA